MAASKAQKRYGGADQSDDADDLSKPKMSPSMQLKEFHPFKDKAERDKFLDQMSHGDVLQAIKRRFEQKRDGDFEQNKVPLSGSQD
jgi:hypothetical protein